MMVCMVAKSSDVESFGRQPVLAGDRIISKRILKYSNSMIKKTNLYN